MRSWRCAAAMVAATCLPGAPATAQSSLEEVRDRVRDLTRGTGLGARLYREFFALAAADGRRTVEAVTSPVNEGSIAFHRRLGFTVRGPVPGYNGPDAAMMVFHADLAHAGTAARSL